MVKNKNLLVKIIVSVVFSIWLTDVNWIQINNLSIVTISVYLGLDPVYS